MFLKPWTFARTVCIFWLLLISVWVGELLSSQELIRSHSQLPADGWVNRTSFQPTARFQPLGRNVLDRASPQPGACQRLCPVFAFAEQRATGFLAWLSSSLLCFSTGRGQLKSRQQRLLGTVPSQQPAGLCSPDSLSTAHSGSFPCSFPAFLKVCCIVLGHQHVPTHLRSE